MIQANEQTKYIDDHFVVNTDQSGFNLEIPPVRTLSYTGEKTTIAAVNSVNSTTYLYTLQYSSTKVGTLLPKVFVCLKEPTGTFGPNVHKEVDCLKDKYKNVIICCSKSGKLDKTKVEKYVKEVINPYVPSYSKSILILDSWSGQKNTPINQM